MNEVGGRVNSSSHLPFCLSLLQRKEIETKGRPQWKKGAPFLQGFHNIGVSGVGVLFKVGFATEKEEEK